MKGRVKEKYMKVEVVWDDAFHITESWSTYNELADAYNELRYRVTNVGWLLYQDKKYIILASKRSENWNSFGATIMIPKGIIVKIKDI